MLHRKVIAKMKAEIKARSAELSKQKRQGRTWKTHAEGQAIRHLLIAYARARGKDDEFIARADAGWQPDGTVTPPENLRGRPGLSMWTVQQIEKRFAEEARQEAQDAAQEATDVA